MAEEKAIGSQDAPNLYQRTRQVIHAVERSPCNDKVKALRLELQPVFFDKTGGRYRTLSFAGYSNRIVCHRSDNEYAFERARYDRQPLGKFVRNMIPQKCLAVPSYAARTQGVAPASVEYLGGVAGGFHFGLVEIGDMSDKRMMLSLGKILKPALDFALPERCPACGAITADGTNFCADCWPKLRFLNPPWCAACGLPFAYEQDDSALCANCLSEPPLHDGIRAVVAYDDLSRQIILRLKYGGKIGLAKLIARQLLRHLPADRGDIVVTPVPLHWTRLWSRSFNQSALIAQELARLGGMQYCPDLLLRIRRTPSMRGLSFKQRRKTVAKALVANHRRLERITRKRIILVDDVLTTGATSDGCIKALKKAGAQWVQLYCWARVMRGEAFPEHQALSLDA
jgi:ComF family protein